MLLKLHQISQKSPCSPARRACWARNAQVQIPPPGASVLHSCTRYPYIYNIYRYPYIHLYEYEHLYGYLYCIKMIQKLRRSSPHPIRHSDTKPVWSHAATGPPGEHRGAGSVTKHVLDPGNRFKNGDSSPKIIWISVYIIYKQISIYIIYIYIIRYNKWTSQISFSRDLATRCVLCWEVAQT